MVVADGRPRTRAELDKRIEREFGLDQGYASASSVMAAAIVAKTLPSGAVKGGSALRLRYGQASTRFTNDVDVARIGTEGDFRESLAQSLRDGWEGFTGTLEALHSYKPNNLQRRYAMVPYLLRLSYLGQSWADVMLEVSHNELGDADKPDLVCSSEVSTLFERVGLPSPGRLPLMRLDFQIAQKLHALSETRNERAHDLVDLQVMLRQARINNAELASLCTRLFAYRKAQDWPPRIEVATTWEGAYASAADGLDVLETVDEATAWANNMIAILAKESQSPSDDTPQS